VRWVGDRALRVRRRNARQRQGRRVVERLDNRDGWEGLPATVGSRGHIVIKAKMQLQHDRSDRKKSVNGVSRALSCKWVGRWEKKTGLSWATKGVDGVEGDRGSAGRGGDFYYAQGQSRESQEGNKTTAEQPVRAHDGPPRCQVSRIICEEEPAGAGFTRTVGCKRALGRLRVCWNMHRPGLCTIDSGRQCSPLHHGRRLWPSPPTPNHPLRVPGRLSCNAVLADAATAKDPGHCVESRPISIS
jgi:hypothetical protein